jgi:hypothetical protein
LGQRRLARAARITPADIARAKATWRRDAPPGYIAVLD